jgi:DNA-directed RNA polymerase subunit H
MAKSFDVTKHALVPKHAKLSEKEKKELLEKYVADLRDLPRVFKDDPAIQHLDVKEGEIIKIIRKSPTAGEAVFYRRVVSS